jgi:hypothetical protein
MGKSSGAGSPLATEAMFLGAGFGLASTFSRMPGIGDQLRVWMMQNQNKEDFIVSA